MDHFDAFLSYYNCELDIQAFFGVFYGDGYLVRPSASGNSRFALKQGFGNPGGLAYFNMVFFPMMAMLAPRFKSSLEPYIDSSVKKGVTSCAWVLESSRAVEWTYLYNLLYDGKVKILPQWLADTFGSVFIAYLLMGDGHWVQDGRIKICTQSFCPECLTILQGVLLREGITTVVRDVGVMKCGRMGQVLMVLKRQKSSILRVQEIARQHFCPEMMYRAGLNPDGTPFKSGP